MNEIVKWKMNDKVNFNYFKFIFNKNSIYTVVTHMYIIPI